MNKVILALLIAGFPFLAFSHEGHDKTPGAVAAPHGGMMKDLEHNYLELVTEGSSIKLYFYEHDLKPISAKDIKVDGSATFPKKSKAEKLAFTNEGESFSATVDAKGAHRYTLDLSVTSHGKKEKTKFNVEPQ